MKTPQSSQSELSLCCKDCCNSHYLHPVLVLFIYLSHIRLIVGALQVNYTCGGQAVFYLSYSFILCPPHPAPYTINCLAHSYSKDQTCNREDIKWHEDMELNNKKSKNDNIILFSIIFNHLITSRRKPQFVPLWF